MIKSLIKPIKTSFMVIVFFSVLTGLVYPLFVTFMSQLLFPYQANGSILYQNNKAVGSSLIGQAFSDAKYFWGRPSATVPYPYNATNSSGSNLGPTNPELLSLVKIRADRLQKANQDNKTIIPIDLVTTSASGLDPEICVASAIYQVPRIAAARKLSETEIESLIQQHIIKRTFIILGEPRINVLELNLALDNYQNERTKTKS